MSLSYSWAFMCMRVEDICNWDVVQSPNKGLNISDQDFTAVIGEGSCWRPFWGFEVLSTGCNGNSIVTCNANWLLEVPKKCTFHRAVLCAPQLCSLLYPGFIWVKFGNELGLSNYLHSREQSQERCLNFWFSTKGSDIHEHLIRTSSTFWDSPMDQDHFKNCKSLGMDSPNICTEGWSRSIYVLTLGPRKE